MTRPASNKHDKKLHKKLQPSRVLVVDDHATARESVADVLRHAGYEATTCSSATEALARLRDETPDVVITDLQMPGMNGLELVQEIGRRQLAVEVLMVTAHASVSTAVEAMRLGAFDYLEKPFGATQLEQSVAQACQRRRLMASPDDAFDDVSGNGETSAQSAMVGSSPVMQELRNRIARVATTDETVLICGESGTGKELVAQAIHTLSHRSHGPMVSLNCPVLSAQLTESELFGHKRGAFTGADADRIGRFEQAQGGSILLDEVTEIDLQLQAKLLRVLQERTFERVGSNETVSVDVRVLASSNRDLQTEVREGRLREDLYYRLAVLPLELPPLRKRGNDVLELADYFLTQAAGRLGVPKIELDDDARALFVEYAWPGNVRELQNVITRACVLIQDRAINVTDIRPWLQMPEGSTSLSSSLSNSLSNSLPSESDATLPVGMPLEEVERQMIVATLERFEGHRAKTAEALGIGVRTLSGKLRAYGYAPREKSFAKAS